MTMYQGKHAFFYTQPPFGGDLATNAAHYDRDNSDGTHRLFVRLEDGSEVPLNGPQCDPAQPVAGHWSEIA
jgi:hypothetical protein